MFVAFDEFDLRRIHRCLVVWVDQVLVSFFSPSIVIAKKAVALFKRFFDNHFKIKLAANICQGVKEPASE
jgi:hypothetical protein